MNAGFQTAQRWAGQHRLLLSVLLIAWLHSPFYVVTLPPWDLYDEEQHLSYALTLRDERRIPRLDEPIQPAILESAIATDRWDAFRLTMPPDVSTPEAAGLEGRSYEAYQPPLTYGILAIVTLPADDDVLDSLYAARVFGSLLFVVLVALTWSLAAAWFPSSRAVAAGAALLVAAFPAAVQASARVSNDLLAAVLITGTLLALTRLLATPGLWWAGTTGVLAAAGLLTKSHSLIALPVIVVGLAILWRRGRLSHPLIALTLLPSVVAAGIWSLVIYRRYGVIDGTSAYLERYQTYQPLPWEKFLKTFWLNSWSDYWGAYGGAGNLLVITNLLLIAIIVVGLAGVIRRAAPAVPVLLTATLVIVLLAALVYANHTAIVRPGGRILLPAYPALAALLVYGWSRLGTRWLVWLPPLAITAASVTYIVRWYAPFFWQS